MRHILATLCLLTATGITGVLTAEARAGEHDRHGYGHHERPDHRDRHELATLAVDNDRFSSVEVRADGRLLGVVGPEDRETFSLRHGGQTITITSGSQVVWSRDTLFRPHQTVEADIPAFEGRLLVRNTTGYDGRVYIDGVDHGPVAAGQERTLVLDPCSGARVEIRGSRYTLDTQTVSIVPGKNVRFTAQAPTLADISIRNPLSVPVRVTVGARGSITVQPGRKVTLTDVPVGTSAVTVRLQGGKVIQTSSLKVNPYKGASITIEGPSAAMVSLHNISREDTRIWIDGSLVSRVDGYGDASLELPVGAHRVVVRDARGNELMDQTYMVTAFGINELVFGASTCPMPDDDRTYSASISW